MDFGLGLVLSFTDNATAGINSAVNSLNQLTQTAEGASSSLNELASLSAFSAIATQMGNSMTAMGSRIISTFGQVIGKVNETGQTLMYAESQLDKLYEGSAKTGKDVLADITQYAKTSIFEFEDLIPVVTMLKANGIEAFDMIASSTGNANQTLMDYAADLAAFNPQMKNAYGTGIKAAMGALNEYIAEGNARSLKAGASLDITGLLGEEKGATIEERSRQVADLLEKLNMVGMTANLANTPMTKLSNMSDTLFQFIGMISQSGVYDAFNEIIDVFAGFVNNIDDSTLQEVAQTVGDALSALLVPVKQIAEWIVKLASAFVDLVKNNPQLAKFATLGTALAGVFLIIGGVALKFAGSLGYLSLMLRSLSTSFGAIGTVMKAGATKIVGALAPVTLALGVMYLVWRNDLFGIRTLVTSFVQNVVNSFKTAKTAVSGSLADMQNTLKTFDTQNSFFDGLTLALMRVMVLFQALAEGWNDYTLSEETFAKAKELGILPLIEAIFNLKYRFDLFKQGFIAGWQKISDKVKAVISDLVAKADGTIFEDLLKGVTSFFEALTNNDADAWYKFGESFAYITAGIIACIATIRTLTKVFKVLSTVFNIVSKGFNGIVKVVEFFIGLPAKISAVWGTITAVIGHAVSDIVGFFQLVAEFGLAETMEGLFGTAVTVASGIVSVIAGAVMAVLSFVDQWKNGFSVIKEILMIVGIALVAVGAILLGAPALIAGIVAGVIALVATLVIVIKQHWEEIKAFFSTIANWINDHIIQPVINFFRPMFDLIGQMWNTFMGTVSHVVERIKGFIGELIAGIKSIWDNIMSYVTPVIETFKELASTFGEFCAFIGGKLSSLWTGTIQPVLSAIGNFFVTIFNKIWGVVQTVWNAIWNFISPVVMAIWNTINSVFTAIFDTIMNVLSNIWNGIVGVFNGIVTFIGSILSGIFQTISNVLMGIMNFIMGKNDEAKENFSNAWNAIKGIFTGALNGIKGIVTSVFNAISGVISSIWNGIKNTFSTVLNGIKNTVSTVFNGIKNTIQNVMNGAWNIVSGAVNKLKSAFNFKWSLPELKLPHISVSGGKAPYGIAGQGSLPKFSIEWYKEGGVFNKPSVIGVGEAGTEAVMPLENNVEWIGTLANMLVSELRSIKPTSQMTSTTTNNQDTTNRYMTNNSTNNNQTYQGDTDNSIVFNSGAIQINCQNASDEEAMRMAQKILEYIKRQRQLDQMLSYA